MGGHEQRKAERTAAFHRNHGRKLVTCTACNGSRHYDTTSSPSCGACGGQGRVPEDAPLAVAPVVHWWDALKERTVLVATRRQRRLGARQ